jgi:hypothetical protein
MTMHATNLLVAGPDLSWLTSFDNEQRFVLIIIGIVFGTIAVLSLTGIIAGTFKGIREKQIDADLKRDMLDRGMTAEEIGKILGSQYTHWMGNWYHKK